MDDWQTWPPNTGFDIFRLAIASVFEDKLGELVDGQPLQTFRNLTGHHLFEKPYTHPAGDDSIAHPAVEGPQISADVLFRAKCVNGLYQLGHRLPIWFRCRFGPKRIAAERGVNPRPYLFFLSWIGEQGNQRRACFINFDVI